MSAHLLEYLARPVGPGRHVASARPGAREVAAAARRRADDELRRAPR